MRHFKLFEQYVTEASKPVFYYDEAKDLPSKGYLVLDIEDVKDVEKWPSFISALKKKGYSSYINSIGYQGPAHKNSPYYTKLTIGPRQEMDLMSALKAENNIQFMWYTLYGPVIAVQWWVEKAHNYHGTWVPERKFWRFERLDEMRFGSRYPEKHEEVNFEDYFKPKHQFRGKLIGRKFGL